MTMLPHSLLNGEAVDHPRYMDNALWLFAMMKGSQIVNGGFESWSNGSLFVNPADADVLADGWFLAKGGITPATANVQQEPTIMDTGYFSKKVIISGAGSSDSWLKVAQSLSDFARFAGLTLTFCAKVKVATGSKVRLAISDGASTAWSNYHDGDDTWQNLNVSLTCAALGVIAGLQVRVEITSDFTDTVYMDSCALYITDPSMSQTARDALFYFRPDERTGPSCSYVDFVPQATPPTPAIGRVYYDSNDKQWYGSKDGTSWNWTLG